MNPYSGQDFFGFFKVLLFRFFTFLSGNLSFDQMATDEVQLVVLSGIAMSCGIIGTFLVLKRMAMLANALSHTILLGIVLCFVFFQPQSIEAPIPISSTLIAAIGMGWLTTFLTEFLTKTVKLSEDASVGLVFTTLFALGVVLVTALTRNVHIGTEVVMGNADALKVSDCTLVWLILTIKVVLLLLFFKEFKLTTFDPGFAAAIGVSNWAFTLLLMTQMAATAIGAFRAVGVLMVLAFMTGPTLAARFFTHDLKRLIALSCSFGVGSAFIGVALSRHFFSVFGLSLSTSGLVVCVIVSLFLLALAYICLKNAKKKLKTSN
jgi:manganese/zinc/iron transport system permease protein